MVVTMKYLIYISVTVSLLAGFVLIFHNLEVTGYSSHTIVYDNIIEKYFPEEEGVNTSVFDVFDLWDDLCVNSREIKNSSGSFLFGSEKGRFDCIFYEKISSPMSKVIAISSQMSQTQILVFKKERSNYIFKYSFCTTPDYSELQSINLHTINDSLEIVEVEYKNSSGTGCYSTLRSFFILHEESANKILTVSSSGYVIGWEFELDRKFNSQLEPLSETWPELIITYQSHYTFLPQKMHLNGPEKVELFKFEEKAFFVWKESWHKFLISPKSQLSISDIEAIYNENSTGFVKRRHEDVKKLYQIGSPIQQQWASCMLNL